MVDIYRRQGAKMGGALCTLIWAFIPSRHLCQFFVKSLAQIHGPCIFILLSGSCKSLSWYSLSLANGYVCNWPSSFTYDSLILRGLHSIYSVCSCMLGLQPRVSRALSVSLLLNHTLHCPLSIKHCLLPTTHCTVPISALLLLPVLSFFRLWSLVQEMRPK